MYTKQDCPLCESDGVTLTPNECSTCGGRGEVIARAQTIAEWLAFYSDEGDCEDRDALVSIGEMRTWERQVRYDLLGPSQQLIIDALIWMDQPGTVQQITDGIKKHLGVTRKQSATGPRCKDLYEAGWLKCWQPRSREELLVYGLPGQELPEDIDRARPNAHTNRKPRKGHPWSRTTALGSSS